MKPRRFFAGLARGVLPSLRRALRALQLPALSMVLCGSAAADTFTVAVVPQFPALDIVRAWGPALERLSQQTGHSFKLMPFASIPAFEAAFEEGKPDFVYLNPYHMVMARAAHQYQPLLRDASAPLSGVLVVAADSPLTRPEQLAGKMVAFPAPNAFGASLAMRAHLAARGIGIEPNYVKTHKNAYRHVLTGHAAAAGGVMQTLKAEPDDVRAGLRVIYETPPAAPHPLAAHPRVPVPVQHAVRETMLAWSATAKEQPLLDRIGIREPMAADYARDYAPLERLGLQRFVIREQP